MKPEEMPAWSTDEWLPNQGVLGRWSNTVGLKKIIEGAYLVPLGTANAVLLDGRPELALVDAGFPGKASVVFDAIRQLGRTPRDLRHLIFTHGHPDHIGSAAAIVRETGATPYMHAVDAGDPVGFEDREEGRRSQRKVAALRFDAAAFGHGPAIRSGTAERFRRKWGQR